MSTVKFPKLFEPGHIGKLEIRNRIVLAPMGTGYEDSDGSINQRQVDYFAARAKGGAGLIITGVVKVYRKAESLPARGFWMDSDIYIAKASDLAESVHDYGAKICVQLTAGRGRQEGILSKDRIPVAPSAIPSFFNPNVLCRELTKEEIKEIAQAYADAAHRIVMAGFDMIEFHGHTGYLIDQFMSPLWNKRTDEYGGNVEKRLRFPIELISRVRDVVGSNFPLSFRLTAEHKIPEGRKLNEALEIAKRLEAAGVDVLHIDAGCYEAMQWVFPPSYYPEGLTVDLAEAIKKEVGIPVITVGRINRPEFAEQILEAQKADFIAMGRQLIADPEWPNKAREGRTEDIRPCIFCNEFCVGRGFTHRPLSCSVNAAAGKERYYSITHADMSKRVMVIGGGPAGMEAARVAALRGHDVTLYEKEKTLGGQLRAASKPGFKVGLARLIDYLTVQLTKTGVKVELEKEVTPLLVDFEKPDAVIIATGATPLTCKIPGIENAIQATDIYAGGTRLGKNLVVAGGGMTGCDIALSLAMEGKNISIVEMRSAVAVDLNGISRLALLEKLAKNNVKMLTDYTIKEFTTKGLIAIDKHSKKRVVQADNVVCAFGSQSENKLVNAIKDRVLEVYVIGDCVSPRKVGESIHEGFVTGWQI